MKVCDICLLKTSLSKENRHCELKECGKSLNIKIYTTDRLTVVTGKSVEKCACALEQFAQYSEWFHRPCSRNFIPKHYGNVPLVAVNRKRKSKLQPQKR